MKILKLTLFLILAFSSKVLAEQPAWELVSMNPPRGTIQYITGNDSTIYLSNSNKYFFSTDLGEHWELLQNDNQFGCVLSIGNSIFMLGNRNNNTLNNLLYKSTDKGNTWYDINGNWDKNNSPWFITGDSNIIYVVLKDGSCYGLIYFSSNLGLSWNYSGQIPYKNINGSYGQIQSYKNTLIVQWSTGYSSENYLYISNDTGKSFKEVLFQNYVYCFYIKSENEYYISSYNGIWNTTDKGENWQQKWFPTDFVPSFTMSNEGKNIFVIKSYTLSSNNPPSFIFSNDYGDTWLNNSDFSNINPISSIGLKILNGMIYAYPKNLGAYKSTIDSVLFKECDNGYTDMMPNGFTITKNNELLFSCWGVFKSTDGGKTFDYLGLKAYNTGPVVTNSKGDIFVSDLGAGNTEKGIFRSTDEGQTWISLFNGAGPVGLIINKRDVIFACYLTGNVICSTDNGNTWESMPVFASAFITNDKGDVFTFSYSNPGHPQGNGINRTTDDGKTWTFLGGDGLGFQDPSVSNPGFAIINNKTKTGWWGWLINADHSFMGVYKTTDNGETWEPINYVNSNIDWHFALAVDSLGCLISYNSGDKYGIYRSCDNGDTWQRLDTTGLKNKEFGPVAVSPDGHIYVFGKTGGLYRSRDRYVSVQEQLKPDYSTGNYSSSDYYEFEYFYRDYVNKIMLYNMLGELVLTTSFSNNDDPMGGTKQINISSLPTGVYFVRVGNRVSKFVKI